MGATLDMYGLVEELYPICRSITGDGVRQTLQVMQRYVPLEIREVPTGEAVLDWTIPREWNIRDAYVARKGGERVIDFTKHNLHVVSYSRPFRGTISRDELLRHVHTLPERPDAIPYRTTYYADQWGFCAAHSLIGEFRDEEYEVCIDATLEDGSLSYGEFIAPGRCDTEVLIYSHTCHPSLANDNLSGLAVTLALAQHIAAQSRRLTYRFVWGPGTIGSIAWLARNQNCLTRIRHAIVAVLLGGPGGFYYKRSQQGDSEIDSMFEHFMRQWGGQVREFDPYGYDERQFCSPGFDLPCGRISRVPHGEFAEYHTSDDNLRFVTATQLEDSFDLLVEVLESIDANQRYTNVAPYGEPQLGRRGLYRELGGEELPQRELALLWLLNQSNGNRSLLEIAHRAELPFRVIRRVADELVRAGLLRKVEENLGSGVST